MFGDCVLGKGGNRGGDVGEYFKIWMIYICIWKYFDICLVEVVF